MNDWTIQHQRAANISPDDSAGPLLDQIQPWQSRAREEAKKHTHHQNKRAVQNTPPTDTEACALYQLFALWAEDIYEISYQSLIAHTRSRARDEPGLALEDVLQEAYILFQRAMVVSESREEMRSVVRARMAEYIRTKLVVDDNPETRDLVEDTEPTAPGFDVPRLYNELREEDRLPRRAERLWDRVTPL